MSALTRAEWDIERIKQSRCTCDGCWAACLADSEPAPAATDTPTHDCADHAITADEGTSHCPECERQARGDARDRLIRAAEEARAGLLGEIERRMTAYRERAEKAERELADAKAALKAIIEEPGLTGKTGSYPARIRVIARAALSRVAETGGHA